ncbi:MAG: type II secretion system protein GspN [Deltaproteobacteria bacterium]|nr:type II secretion system protein GspN [Deltaproteobacteria bacterium]
MTDERQAGGGEQRAGKRTRAVGGIGSLIFYAAFAVVMILLFLHVLFPAPAVVDFLIEKLKESRPDIMLSYGSARLVFPPALSLADLQGGIVSLPGSRCRAEKATMRPLVGALIRGDLLLENNIRALGGVVDVRVDLPLKRSSSGLFGLEGTCAAIDLAACDLLRSVTGREIAGILDGTFSFRGSSRDLKEGGGKASFVVRNGAVKLMKEMIGFDRVAFDALEAEIRLEEGRILVDRCVLRGRQIKGSLTGAVRIGRAMDDSGLALKGRLELPLMGRSMNVVIAGTVNNPLVRFR